MDFFYYNLAILGSAQELLTYSSPHDFSIGECVKTPLRSHLKSAIVLSKIEKPSFKCKKINSSLKEYFSSQQLQIAKFISEYYGASIGETLALMHPYPTLDSRFIEFKSTASLALSLSQTKAKEFLASHKYALLFGDTGSGKTEIYLSLIQEVLEKGESSIFLMPEIGLTPQMQTRLERHFGPRVAVWHSKLTKKKKEEILSAIHEGVVRIVAGPRSALFLPLYKLGLIVVDEEHDESYKSASRPRYNARDVALWMSSKLEIKVVLGSATPSLGTYEKLPKVRLRGTYFKSSRQIVYESGLHTLSEKIISKLKATLEKGRQAIVFVPTRAHFKTLTCKDCGAIIECPFCSVSMSLHRKANALKCHYCNYAEPIPNACPKCNGATIEASRIGTAEVIDELSKQLPNARVGQFDKDAVRTERQLKSLLKAFNKRELDILVGTQMLSKGHDYHDIGLSVIIGLDA
ncbi:MAG: primosomal protein N', partial [Campylobacteraceae bacterium]|nr:primosomal protein N' [Campylobacteraceae bacterium]